MKYALLRQKLRTWLGLWRSVLIYYWKPFNKRRLRRFYATFVKSGDLCFDVGAHLGNRTHAWLALGASVVAVEPQTVCINYLKRRFGKHPRFELVEDAIGATPGTAHLHVSAFTPTVSTLSHQAWRKAIDEDTSFKVKWEQQKEVRVRTLDQLIAQYGIPTFCKLDIENFEYEALQGLHHPIPCLSIEFYPAAMQQSIQCVHRLAELGNYRFNWSFGESQQLEHQQWVSKAEILAFFQQVKRGEAYGDFYARLEEKP